jgi:SNF2 family DNA or RNA helicase
MVKIKYTKKVEKLWENYGFNSLPDEILLQIFEYAGTLSTYSMKTVCRRFHRIISGEMSLPKWIHRYIVPQIGPKLYQFEVVKWMMDQKHGGILNMEQGMGKTNTCLTYINVSYSNRNLVICNKSQLFIFKKETKKFYGDRFKVVCCHKEADGDIRKFTKESLELYDIVITTYECAKHLVNEESELSQIYWNNVFCDEVHRLRNAPESMYPFIQQIKRTKFWGLTGSLIFNDISDARNVQRLVDPASVYSISNIKVLKFSDVKVKLPTLFVEKVHTDRNEKQNKLYDMYENTAIDLLEKLGAKKETYSEIFTIIHRLRQTSISPHLLQKSHKNLKLKKTDRYLTPRIEKVSDYAQKAEGQSVVFCYYRETLDLVELNLKKRGVRCKVVKSEDSLEYRESTIKRFVKGKYRVLLMTYRVGGEGYNLANATTVILASPWWNAQVLQQAFKRCYRLGQTKPVDVKIFLTKDSIEDRMLQLCAQKEEIEKMLLADYKPRGRLTMKEIKMLF